MKTVPEFKTKEEETEFLEAKKAETIAKFAFEHARIDLRSAKLHVGELEPLTCNEKEWQAAIMAKKTAYFAYEHASITLMTATLRVQELESKANNSKKGGQQ